MAGPAAPPVHRWCWPAAGAGHFRPPFPARGGAGAHGCL